MMSCPGHSSNDINLLTDEDVDFTAEDVGNALSSVNQDNNDYEDEEDDGDFGDDTLPSSSSPRFSNAGEEEEDFPSNDLNSAMIEDPEDLNSAMIENGNTRLVPLRTSTPGDRLRSDEDNSSSPSSVSSVASSRSGSLAPSSSASSLAALMSRVQAGDNEGDEPMVGSDESDNHGRSSGFAIVDRQRLDKVNTGIILKN